MSKITESTRSKKVSLTEKDMYWIVASIRFAVSETDLKEEVYLLELADRIARECNLK